MRKKVLSVFMAVAMIFSLVTPVYATSKTRDDAINWVRSKENQKIGSGQCVALISAYYSYLGVSPVSGNGCDYATNSLPSGWTREKGGVPKKGDILVYTGGYGHVAIAETTSYGWHQNWGGQYVQWVDRNYSSSFYSSYEGVTKKYWGCIRPNFSDAPADPIGTPVDVGNDFYTRILKRDAWKAVTYDTVCNVFLQTIYENPNQIWHFQRQNDGTYKITNLYDNTVLEVQYESKEPGANIATYEWWNGNSQKWYVYGNDNKFKLRAKNTNCVMDVVSNCNDDGINIATYTFNDTSAQNFHFAWVDVKPATLSVDVGSSCKKTGFSWSGATFATLYDLKIWKDKLWEGNAYEIIWGAEGGSCNILLPAGHYEAYVDTRHGKTIDMGNVVAFDVVEDTSAVNIFSKVMYTDTEYIVNANIKYLTQPAVYAAALYASDGRMLDIQTISLSGGETSASAALSKRTDANYIKVFLWDDLESMQPLCDCERLSI